MAAIDEFYTFDLVEYLLQNWLKKKRRYFEKLKTKKSTERFNREDIEQLDSMQNETRYKSH